jgi:hypothetical protein
MGSDLDRQIQTLLQCKIITEAEVKELCLKAREILVEESNVQRVDAPVTVCECCVSLRTLAARYTSTDDRVLSPRAKICT